MISRYKIFVLSLCPVTLVIGHIIAYFASPSVELNVDKDGLLNTVFVKKGWFWTSLVGWWCLIRYSILNDLVAEQVQKGNHSKNVSEDETAEEDRTSSEKVNRFKKIAVDKSQETSKRNFNVLKSQVIRVFFRYSILTIWWVLFTQSMLRWAPLMDLIFTFSGGSCNFEVFDTLQEDWTLNENFQDSSSRRWRSLKKLYKALKKVNVTEEFKESPKLLKNTIVSLESWLKCKLGSGSCESKADVDVSPAQVNQFVYKILHAFYRIDSSQKCKSLGGHWSGGHDPSGHIFLITLMCMFLLGELQMFWSKSRYILVETWSNWYWSFLKKNIFRLLNNGGLWNVINNDSKDTNIFIQIFLVPPLQCFKCLAKISVFTMRFVAWENPIILLVSLVFVWWWNFLVTTIVFHTISEQLSGLICAYVVAGLVYWKVD